MKRIRPNKRPRAEFLHIRTLLGMSRQEQADFSYADLERFFKVTLWDRSHTCRYEKCPFPNRLIKTFEEASLDHILPKSRGGRTRLCNLQLMHTHCNTKKSNHKPSWFHPKAMSPVDSRRGQPTHYTMGKKKMVI